MHQSIKIDDFELSKFIEYHVTLIVEQQIGRYVEFKLHKLLDQITSQAVTSSPDLSDKIKSTVEETLRLNGYVVKDDKEDPANAPLPGLSEDMKWIAIQGFMAGYWQAGGIEQGGTQVVDLAHNWLNGCIARTKVTTEMALAQKLGGFTNRHDFP